MPRRPRLRLLPHPLASPQHPPVGPRPRLDAGYDCQPVYTESAERGITAEITERGTRTPIRADGRWVVEHTNSWLNSFGRLRRNTERSRIRAEFYLALATAIITVRSLIRRAWYTCR